ncbi:MAG: hypothetical protein WBO23_03100, partial [Burkholderiales bacterium]
MTGRSRRPPMKAALGAASVAVAAVLLADCQSPPLAPAELAALDYGPRPDHYEEIVREYLSARLEEPRFALLEFRAGPKPLYQKEALLRERRHGWAVCVTVTDKNRRGAYDAYPMVIYIRDGKVVAANGDGLERAAGVRYAHAQCR